MSDETLDHSATPEASGETLAQWISREGALPEETVVGLGIYAASALKSLWDNEQRAHGGVRPEHILVDAEGDVKLGEPDAAATNRLEAHHYCPPELGEDEAADFPSDIYSLSLTLYHALTGKTPFQDGWERAEQMPDPRTFAPKTSPHLCRVLEKMAAKEKAQRYASWEEALGDLELVASKQPPQLPLNFKGTSSVRRELLFNPQHKAAGNATATTTAISQPTPPPPPPRSKPTHFEAAPSNQAVGSGHFLSITVKMILFGALVAGLNWYYVRHVESLPPEVTYAFADPWRQYHAAVRFHKNHPLELNNYEGRLQRIVREFPDTQAEEEAQRLLNDMPAQLLVEAAQCCKEDLSKAYDYIERLQLMADKFPGTNEATAASQLIAEKRNEIVAYNLKMLHDTEGQFVALLKQRQYGEARKLATDAMGNPLLAPIKNTLGGLADFAGQLDVFFKSLPLILGQLKGRIMFIDGFNFGLTLLEVKDGKLILGMKTHEGESAHHEVPVAKLTANDIGTLVKRADAEKKKSADLARFHFAELDFTKAEANLNDAAAAGIDVASTQTIMNELKKAAQTLAELLRPKKQ